LAITKLDVLDGLAEINICTGFRLPDGTVIDLRAGHARLRNR
jgi:adenylosuccinate synthase